MDTEAQPVILRQTDQRKLAVDTLPISQTALKGGVAYSNRITMRRSLSKPLGFTWRMRTKAQIEANGKKGKNDVHLRGIETTTSSTETRSDTPTSRPFALLRISADYYHHRFTQNRRLGLL